ncbi:acyltransferase family protein [Sphingomonas sp.]|uniref:acyltransferase family protein n=1 Tax=Sphingomonas sp. TaxID=28214 RepID=UPI003CC6535B
MDRNNIGLMRLSLATMVIVGHASELTDGDRSREPLTQVLPFTSLGETAVSGFFLLSGYLITKSMLRQGDVAIYLVHRLLRIVPGFAVAYLVSFYLFGLGLGVNIWPYQTDALVNMAALRETPLMPLMPAKLAIPYPTLNGALWTISYEFRCYLLVAVLWMAGVLGQRRAMLIIAAVLVLSTTLTGSWTTAHALEYPGRNRVVDLLVGRITMDIRFMATFMVGACCYLWRDEVDRWLTGRLALASLCLAIIAFQFQHSAPVAGAALLALPVFWLAFKVRLGPLRRINERFDISYGTYLYGFPFAIALILLLPHATPFILRVAGVPLAWIAGTLSWFGVERPMQLLAKRITRKRLDGEARFRHPAADARHAS